MMCKLFKGHSQQTINQSIDFQIFRLIHLFEGGILDKMTTAEYENQSRMIVKDLSKKKKKHNEDSSESIANPDKPNTSNEASGKSADNAEMKKPQDIQIIQPINLRMLQGAFIVLIVGYTLAGKATYKLTL